MLNRIEAAMTSGITNPICTGIECNWTIPKGVKTTFEMRPIKNLSFSTATYQDKGNKKEREENLKALMSIVPTSTKRSQPR